MYKRKGSCHAEINLNLQQDYLRRDSGQTTGPRFPWTYKNGKLTDLKHFSLPFTLFEACGAVFIIPSKINWRKISLNEYFKAISHYLFQCLLFTFGLDARSSSSSLFWLKFISPFLIIIAKTLLQSQGSSLAQVLKLIKVVHFDRSGHFGRSVGPKCPFPFDKIVVPCTAPLYSACKNNKQTHSGLARVCANGMYRSIGQSVSKAEGQGRGPFFFF